MLLYTFRNGNIYCAATSWQRENYKFPGTQALIKCRFLTPFSKVSTESRVSQNAVFNITITIFANFIFMQSEAPFSKLAKSKFVVIANIFLRHVDPFTVSR